MLAFLISIAVGPNKRWTHLLYGMGRHGHRDTSPDRIDPKVLLGRRGGADAEREGELTIHAGDYGRTHRRNRARELSGEDPGFWEYLVHPDTPDPPRSPDPPRKCFGGGG